MIKITESNVTIMVKNMDISVNFYQSIGFTIKQRWENHYAMLSAEGITIGLHPSDGDEVSSTAISIGLMIENIEDAKNLLLKNGIEFKQDGGSSGIYLHFKDPDGTLLYYVLPQWDREY